jgi:hypothetical protein
LPARDVPATGVLAGHETAALEVGTALHPVVLVMVFEVPPQPAVIVTERVAAIERRARRTPFIALLYGRMGEIDSLGG